MSSMDGIRQQLADLTARVEELEKGEPVTSADAVDLNALITEQAKRIDALERANAAKPVAGVAPTAAKPRS